jgi:hypothetical protein
MKTSTPFIRALARSRISQMEALRLIGGFHLGRRGRHARLRSEVMVSVGTFYTHADDIEPLLAMLYWKLGRLWPTCRNVIDDLHVAALAAHTILAIHPFEDANTRSCLDMARLLLAWRWDLEDPPLELGVDNPAELPVAHLLDSTNRPSELTAENVRKKGEDIARRLQAASVPALRSDPLLHGAAMLLFGHASPAVQAAGFPDLPEALVHSLDGDDR